jgi:hypothetical protein
VTFALRKPGTYPQAYIEKTERGIVISYFPEEGAEGVQLGLRKSDALLLARRIFQALGRK